MALLVQAGHKDIMGNFGRNYIAAPTRGKGNSWNGEIRNLKVIRMCVKFHIHQIIITPWSVQKIHNQFNRPIHSDRCKVLRKITLDSITQSIRIGVNSTRTMIYWRFKKITWNDREVGLTCYSHHNISWDICTGAPRAHGAPLEWGRLWFHMNGPKTRFYKITLIQYQNVKTRAGSPIYLARLLRTAAWVRNVWPFYIFKLISPISNFYV